MVSKPIRWHCVAGVQLFKRCRNLSAGTLLQGCSCLRGVKTYLLALCCRVQLFKRCQNLPAGTVMQRCRLFKQCWNLPARHCVARVQAV